jgi:hypothetical protein
MPEAQRPDAEARIRAEVDRAVAPYEGKVPPFMVAKLRQLAERYWREHPEASRILHLVDHQGATRSGVTATAEPDHRDAAARTQKE